MINENIRFIRHDRHNEKVREINAAAVRKALGDFFFDRLVANVGRGPHSNGSFAIEAHGFVFEAIRVR